MRKILYTDKISRDLYTRIYGDLHYVKESDLDFFKSSIQNYGINNPDYVFFLGDLIDDSKCMNEDLKELYELLYRLTKLTKVIFILGNHDGFTKGKNGHWEASYNPNFINELKNIGVIVLQNEYYHDENLYVYGDYFQSEYYIEKEPLDTFLRNVSSVDFNGSDKFNILLEHSPKHIFNRKIFEQFEGLNNTDLVLSAHYHNGCIPPYISKIIPGNIGLLSPYKELIPKYARGNIEITENTKGIISSPLRMFPSNSKLTKINDMFYKPIEQEVLIKIKKK